MKAMKLYDDIYYQSFDRDRLNKLRAAAYAAQKKMIDVDDGTIYVMQDNSKLVFTRDDHVFVKL